jgi:hypothetical protein
MMDEFDGFYAPIAGSAETPSPHRPVETDATLLGRTNRMRKEYDDLREEMIQELEVVEERMSQPAENAKSYLAPMKKTIKKRNDKKVSGACTDGLNIPLGYLKSATNPHTTVRIRGLPGQSRQPHSQAQADRTRKCQPRQGEDGSGQLQRGIHLHIFAT